MSILIVDHKTTSQEKVAGGIFISFEDPDKLSPLKVFFGIGLDCHSLEEGNGIIIGGYQIKCNLKSVAHSDGDVLTHAIIDALCGALNLGDIGQHFPNTPSNKNISSIELLKKMTISTT